MKGKSKKKTENDASKKKDLKDGKPEEKGYVAKYQKIYLQAQVQDKVIKGLQLPMIVKNDKYEEE